MQKVTDITEVKADLAGTYAVQLSLVVEHLEAVTKYYHGMDHDRKRRIPFAFCDDGNCSQARLLIHNSRRMIEQGV